MSSLFDENLSPRLVRLVADLFPHSESVLSSGMGGSTDPEVWNYAVEKGLVLVTKDLDFAEMTRYCSTAKVIWIRLGNCTTDSISAALRDSCERIRSFTGSEDNLMELP